MREIRAGDITAAIKRLCQEANLDLGEDMLRAFDRALIGKGHRSHPVREAMRQHKAVYFGAVGGAGALLSKYNKAAEIVAYEDLGTEAIRRLAVEDFPVIVVDDTHGNDLYEEGMRQYARPAGASRS